MYRLSLLLLALAGCIEHPPQAIALGDLCAEYGCEGEPAQWDASTPDPEVVFVTETETVYVTETETEIEYVYVDRGSGTVIEIHLPPEVGGYRRPCVDGACAEGLVCAPSDLCLVPTWPEDADESDGGS